jgi:hypothetical protein
MSFGKESFGTNGTNGANVCLSTKTTCYKLAVKEDLDPA